MQLIYAVSYSLQENIIYVNYCLAIYRLTIDLMLDKTYLFSF